MSQVAQERTLTRLLFEKGIFTKKEFLEMVKNELYVRRTVKKELRK